MIKRLLLLGSMLLLALPVAAQEPELVCQSVKELSTITMGTYYSLKPSSVTVNVKNVFKPEDTKDVTTSIETTYRDDVCHMKWLTPALGCMSQLQYLDCKSAKEFEEDKARAERLRVIFRNFPSVEDKPEPEAPLSPDAS